MLKKKIVLEFGAWKEDDPIIEEKVFYINGETFEEVFKQTLVIVNSLKNDNFLGYSIEEVK